MDPQRLSPGEKSSNELERNSPETEETTFAPIASPPTHQDSRNATTGRRLSRASHSLERSWSLNDGVSVPGDDSKEKDVEQSRNDANSDDGYVVSWDEFDPMNPRNMSKARKWVIVIIVSTGSLCV